MEELRQDLSRQSINDDMFVDGVTKSEFGRQFDEMLCEVVPQPLFGGDVAPSECESSLPDYMSVASQYVSPLDLCRSEVVR